MEDDEFFPSRFFFFLWVSLRDSPEKRERGEEPSELERSSATKLRTRVIYKVQFF